MSGESEVEIRMLLASFGLEDLPEETSLEELQALLHSVVDGGVVASENTGNNIGTSAYEAGDIKESEGDDAKVDAIVDEVDPYAVVVQSFCDITGSAPEAARYTLEAFNWDLDTALAIFVGEDLSAAAPLVNELGGGRSPDLPPIVPSRSILRPPPSSNSDEGNGIDIGSENVRSLAAMMDDFSMASSMPDGPMRRMMMGLAHHDDEDDHSPGGARRDEYDEYGVRKPDKVRQQQLLGPRSGIGGGSMDESEFAFSRGDDPNVEWMFPCPSHLSFPGPLNEAKDAANTEHRWLLVNLQSHNEFTSHLLNRDTWTDETIVSILRTTFLFWQRGHTSGDGKVYMRMHRLEEDDLPHIGVIDPRTGAKLLTLTGLLTPDELAVRLMEFTEQHSLEEDESPPPALSPSVSEAKSLQTRGGSNSKTEADKAPLQPPTNTTTATTTTTTTIVSAPNTKGPPPPAVDYGEVPEEPTDSEGDTTRISFKFPNGKSLVRRCKKDELVRALFAVAALYIADNQLENPAMSAPPSTSTSSAAARLMQAEAPPCAPPFDLITSYPPQSLRDSLSKTVAECALHGSKVVLRWL